MSGSSLDGLDIAIVDFGIDGGWKLEFHQTIPYSTDWIKRLQNFTHLPAREYIKLKFDYSNLVANTFKSLNLHVDYISSHGHTLVHEPENGITEQIGNGGIIAGITAIPTMADFRTIDLGFGGVGTPLAPLADLSAFPGYNYYLNLGGIANITVLDNNQLTAFDIAPCNQVFNFLSSKIGLEYDDKGLVASRGNYLQNLEHEFSNYSYFTQKGPKSLDNGWIKNVFLDHFKDVNPQDGMHTYSKWLSKEIVKNLKFKSGSKMLITGGGAHNDYLIRNIESELSGKDVEIIIPQKEIINFKEAILMAFLGYYYLNDKPNVFKAVTGSDRDHIGGALYKITPKK